MNIEEYLSRLNTGSNSIFDKSIAYRSQLGTAHHASSCIYEFSENIADTSERKILQTVSSQLESATFSACKGMYRQAFVSLRLALEMGLASAYFSIYKLELHEWLDGRGDIKWSSLICENDGVLSTRFSKAFFEEFEGDMGNYREKAKDVYRQLSEYVHGNNETWESSEIELSFDENKLSTYFISVKGVAEILLFVLSCRYLKSFSSGVLESLEFIPEEMKHLGYVREYFGGPKE
ncbi:hypothetical protein [Marinagarivorans algicola]|uniref:hypothetical protein n=1 Tax=Marinagarivorans algicola TaxID=1513270 RepID=UPI0006B4D944|nr:hypothetical protein [Marinagarivorans algicola]